jgi:hypothetical protein
MGRVCGGYGVLNFSASVGMQDYSPYTNATGGSQPHSHGDTGLAGSHTHTLGAKSDVSSWRMLANVGIIVEKD